jgi:hypothetical protein
MVKRKGVNLLSPMKITRERIRSPSKPIMFGSNHESVGNEERIEVWVKS